MIGKHFLMQQTKVYVFKWRSK